jgi:hypothetical protein
MAPQKKFTPRPQRRTAVRAVPHPSGGRGEAYNLDFRHFNMFAVQTGREDDPLMVQARDLRLVPSTRTNRRHRRQLLQTRGHATSFGIGARETGVPRSFVVMPYCYLHFGAVSTPRQLRQRLTPSFGMRTVVFCRHRISTRRHRLRKLRIYLGCR